MTDDAHLNKTRTSEFSKRQLSGKRMGEKRNIQHWQNEMICLLADVLGHKPRIGPTNYVGIGVPLLFLLLREKIRYFINQYIKKEQWQT